jgi:hypothetical protein
LNAFLFYCNLHFNDMYFLLRFGAVGNLIKNKRIQIWIKIQGCTKSNI